MRKPRTTTQPTPADGSPPAKPVKKDDRWDDRLRRVGDANYVAVVWSTRDKPNWPLPTD
jgi:hypothetical protein